MINEDFNKRINSHQLKKQINTIKSKFTPNYSFFPRMFMSNYSCNFHIFSNFYYLSSRFKHRRNKENDESFN